MFKLVNIIMRQDNNTEAKQENQKGQKNSKNGRQNSQEKSNEEKSSEQKSTLVWLLDESIPLPGGYRVGLDGILGLIPGIGDVASSGISTFILYKAYKQNVPKLVMFKMLLNIILDTVLGAIPIIGDLFDFAWKANTKNAYLLDEYHSDPNKTYRRSVAATGVFILMLIGILVLCLASVYFLVKLIFAIF